MYQGAFTSRPSSSTRGPVGASLAGWGPGFLGNGSSHAAHPEGLDIPTATCAWFAPAGGENVDQSDIIEAIRVQREGADALLMGRVTFEEMRGFWPLQINDATGITAYLNSISKYVVSTTLGDPEWERTTVLSGDLADAVRALKAGPGSEIVCTGSITLVTDLIEAELIDEYRLFVYPVVLGHGRRLFANGAAPHDFRLLEARSFRSGVVLLRYRVG